MDLPSQLTRSMCVAQALFCICYISIQQDLRLRATAGKVCSKLTLCRKKAISSQSAELQALEVRLRETEERLKERQSKSSSPALGGSAYSSPHRRPPIGRTFSGQENDRRQARAYNPPATQPLSQARPPNAKMGSYSRPIVPGGTPETRQDNPSPDCVMVDQTADGQKDQ